MDFRSNHLMVLILAIFINFVTLSSQAPTRALYEASVAQKHEQWMEKHGRVYPDKAEKERQLAIFRKNVEYVEQFNKEGNKTYKLSINKFSDMTNQEFRSHHTGYKMPTSSNASTSFQNKSYQYQSLSDADIPTRMDWREQHAVTGIKDQDRCGACWAFTVVAAVEGLTEIKTGRLVSLSEQQLVDCSHQNSGCRGGSLEDAYEYVIQNGGMALEETYQYQSTDMGTCDSNKETEYAAQITGYEQVPSRREDDLLKAVSMQPVSISIAAYGNDFQHYSSGVFSGECGMHLDHAVTAIGYGTTEDGISYWILKNSWGEQWGENGYMRILRNSDAPEGICGLAMNAFYPTA